MSVKLTGTGWKKKAEGYKSGDIIGKFGLEKINTIPSCAAWTAAGKWKWTLLVMVTVLGKREPQPGNNLVLTLDSRIQKAAEEGHGCAALLFADAKLIP